MVAGVSKEEVLLAMVLFETAMEGTEFFYRSNGLNVLFLILILKLLATGILWFGLIYNKVGSRRILYGWCCIGILLDVAYTGLKFVPIIYSYSFNTSLLLDSTYLVIRLLFWIGATFLLVGFAREEGPWIFKSGFSTGVWENGSFERSFLLWEVMWYPIVVIAVMVTLQISDYYQYRFVLLQMANVHYWYTTTIYIFLSIASCVTLVGRLCGWKLFLKFWVFVYMTIGIVLYAGTNVLEIRNEFHDARIARFWLILVCGMLLLALILRVITLVRIFSFAYKGKRNWYSETIKPKDDEKQSLISSHVQISTE